MSNVNEIVEQRIVDALNKQTGKPPRKIELGGGYYYKCYWVACNNTVTRWQNYCDQCGTRLDWDDS